METHTITWNGAIQLGHPISGTLAAVVALAIAAGLLAFAAFGSITQKARVGGLVVPTEGAVTVAAIQSGTLTKIHVKEGDYVHEGQVLFELSTERMQGGGELSTLIEQQLSVRNEAIQSERAAKIRIAQEKQRTVAARIVNAEAESEQLDSEIKLLYRRKGLAQQSLAKFETLQINGYVSEVQAQQKQEDLLDIESRLSELVRTKTQLGNSLIDLIAERSQQIEDCKTALAQLKQAEASLAQETVQNQDRKRTLIVASQNGTLTALNYHVGQALIAGQSIATLIPGGGTSVSLEAQLYAPSRTAGFVKPGQKVLIRYEAFPYQKFGLQEGVVADVSRTPFSQSELPANISGTVSGTLALATGSVSSEALYRIRVKLKNQTILAYGESKTLKPGMTLEADIVQGERKIWEWVAEPVLAMSPSNHS